MWVLESFPPPRAGGTVSINTGDSLFFQHGQQTLGFDHDLHGAERDTLVSGLRCVH